MVRRLYARSNSRPKKNGRMWSDDSTPDQTVVLKKTEEHGQTTLRQIKQSSDH